MKRFLILLTLVAALLAVPAQAPAAAHVSTWKGVVVAKDVGRGTVAIASATGSVQTIRVAESRTLRIGQRLRLRGTALADGTVEASSLAVAGHARTTRLKAVVVSNQRAHDRLLVSAGRSTFALRIGRATRALASVADSGPRPGDRIDATVSVAGGTAQAIGVNTVGRLGVLEVEGILTKAAAGSVELLVAKAGFVTLTLPAGFALPAGIKVFDEVEVQVAVGTDGKLSVLTIRGDDDRNRERDVDVDEDEGEVEVTGKITALSDSSITVSPSAAAAAVTCALPKPLTGFTVGQFVELECVASGAAGSLVLKKIEHEDNDDDRRDDDDRDDHHDNSGPGGGGGGHGSG